MINNKTVLCLILARGGSKGVKNKNITNLGGKPLIQYSIEAALKTQYIDRLIVSSDSEAIRKISVELGAEAPFKRPDNLSGDQSNVHDAFQHAVSWAEKDSGFKYDYLIELLCTNPFKTHDDIDNVIEKLHFTGADSVIGVTKLEDHHPARIKKIVDDKIKNFSVKEIIGTNRQDLKPDAFIRNGSIYSCKRSKIRSRVGSSNSRPYIMPPSKSINIDTELDLILAEEIIKRS